MARISSLQRDSSLTREDLIGVVDINQSRGSRNSTLGDISDFNINQLALFVNGSRFFLSDGDEIIESGLRQDVSVEDFSSFFISSTSSLAVSGNNITPTLSTATHIKLFNLERQITFVSPITYDSTLRTISLSIALSSDQFNSFRTEGTSAKLITVGELIVEGDFRVTGNIPVKNQRDDTDLFFWIGSEQQYQQLVTDGSLNANTLYHRTI